MERPVPAAPDVDLHQRSISPEELLQRLEALEALVSALRAEVAELRGREP
jgi:hypothetical protein